jgi:hypothetical protein
MKVMLMRPSRSLTPPAPTSAAGITLPADGFIPETTLDFWLRAGLATRDGAMLALTDGRRFTLVEGLRILGRRDGESDPYSLTGRVMSLGALLKRGAVLSPHGARIGAATYDLDFGSLAQPWAAPT